MQYRSVERPGDGNDVEIGEFTLSTSDIVRYYY